MPAHNMSALDVTEAEVVTESGDHFVAPVANLGSTGLFLKTTEPLQFGQRVSLRTLGVTARGEVLFVSSNPPGVVVGLRANPTTLATLEAYRNQVEVIAGADEPEDPWEEKTRAGPPYAVEQIEAPDDKTPIEAALGAAVHADAVPQLVDLSTPLEVLTPYDTPKVDMPPLRALEGPKTFIDEAAANEDEDTIEAPAQREPAANEDEDTIEASAQREPPAEDEGLPTLDGDGYTVRFASASAYRRQFTSHITHGGLVARAAPLPIGTQRMLSLVVPGVGTYTVSARVIFNSTGKLGFMLDSFSVHRNRLAAMAQAN